MSPVTVMDLARTAWDAGIAIPDKVAADMIAHLLLEPSGFSI
jgi:hypothetical protein